MQDILSYESYTTHVVAAYKNGTIPVEVALKKILDMVISAADSGQLKSCLWACSQIADIGEDS